MFVKCFVFTVIDPPLVVMAAPIPPLASLPTALGFLHGALFDIDGTLADTDAHHREVFRELLAPLNIHCDRAYFEQNISGRSNALIVADLLPHLSTEQAAAWSHRKEELFRERARAHLKPLDGLVELLAGLRARGVRLAAVTNAPRLNVDMMLSVLGLADAFHTVVIGGEDCARPKPHPDPYLEAMRRLGLSGSPERCVVFEDSPTGVAAAVAARAGLVVGLKTSQGPRILREAGANITARDFTDLAQDVLALEQTLQEFVTAASAASAAAAATAAVSPDSSSASSASSSSPSSSAAAQAPSSVAPSAGAGLNIAVSTHVLNTSNGLPAANMLVTFQAQSSSGSDSQSWTTLGSDRTNADGRISTFPPIVVGAGVASASYRLLFESAEYFEQQGITPAFFPQITLQWSVDAQRDQNRTKLHVPLLLSPFGYSTYRGS